MRVTEVALATSVPPSLRRPGPGGVEAGPGWLAACMASWPAPGWRVLSVNPPEEAPALPPGIAPAPSAPGVAGAYGRPGAWIPDALAAALATGAPVVGLVNADILLDLDAPRRAALLGRARDGILACNRMDVLHAAQAEGPFYRYGYDLLLMPRGIAERLDLGGFAFGVPWWDYWILLDAVLQGVPVAAVQCTGLRHLAHREAWSEPARRRALAVLVAHLAPRRAALGALGLDPVAEAAVDLLLAATPHLGAAYGVEEMLSVAGTRFGMEVVRIIERDAWRLA
jgi:hypothetical protein